VVTSCCLYVRVNSEFFRLPRCGGLSDQIENTYNSWDNARDADDNFEPRHVWHAEMVLSLEKVGQCVLRWLPQTVFDWGGTEGEWQPVTNNVRPILRLKSLHDWTVWNKVSEQHQEHDPGDGYDKSIVVDGWRKADSVASQLPRTAHLISTVKSGISTVKSVKAGHHRGNCKRLCIGIKNI